MPQPWVELTVDWLRFMNVGEGDKVHVADTRDEGLAPMMRMYMWRTLCGVNIPPVDHYEWQYHKVLRSRPNDDDICMRCLGALTAIENRRDDLPRSAARFYKDRPAPPEPEAS